MTSVVGVEVNKQKHFPEEKEMSDDIEARLGALHEKIVNLNSDQSMIIWERDSEEASDFLQTVVEVRQLVEQLTASLVSRELLCYADNTLQMAMAKLEDEFVHLLLQYRQAIELEQMSFRSSEEEEDFSSSSFEEDSIRGKSLRENSRSSEDFVIDLIQPDAVFHLRCIAEMMLSCNYDKELCQAYIDIRKEALEDCLSVLRMEKLSIEEVLQLDWVPLNSMIKRWNRALKVFIRIYLASERRLCDLIFGDCSESLKQSCFIEITKGSILQLLNMGEAIAIGPLQSEKLFRILDMYEGLADLLTDVESLFPNESGSFVLAECMEVLSRLGESVRGTFSEFKNNVGKNTSTMAFAGGGVHPLTKYVMNYIKALAVYSETLDGLLKHPGAADLHYHEEGRASSPVASNLRSVTSILESNLSERSMLYRDNALQNFFMMNNICYMVQKAKDSDLGAVLGDDWIRTHRRKFRQHAVSYERASWNPVLGFLRDEGIHGRGSTTASRTVLKDRFKNFNLAFEDVYRVQTAWSVPNVELRDDLRISISLRVLQAYRTFIGRFANQLDGVRHRDHYIKYGPDDLEISLLDLFEETAKVMPPRRR